MLSFRKIFWLAAPLATAAIFLHASGGVITLISTNIVDNTANTSHRFEPSSAVGSTTWATSWQSVQTGTSFVAAWNGSSWNAPKTLTPPGDVGTQDVNLAWDPARQRFVLAALGALNPKNIYYGYSTDSTGSQWIISTQPVFSSAIANWDYPSIGVDASGRVLIVGVRVQGNNIAGYYAAVSLDGSSFSSPSPVVTSCVPSSVECGTASRVIATNNLFEAFVPVTDDVTHLPYVINRYESSDGISWAGPLSIGMGQFGEPANNNPSGPPYYFYAPLLSAAGSANGLWSVVFQVNNGGYNNVVLCTSDRGCGMVNTAQNDQFLAGTSVSGDSAYWVNYFTYQNPRNPPLITQAIYFPPGAGAVGATINTGIDPASWDSGHVRCVPNSSPCYVEGDFNGIASNSFAAASTPLIQQATGRPNDLLQNFIQDPPTGANLPNFKPNYVSIRLGADLRSIGQPVPPAAWAIPWNLRYSGSAQQADRRTP